MCVVSSRIISEMLTEFHTTKKCDFLKLIIHSEIILSPFINSYTTNAKVLAFRT